MRLRYVSLPQNTTLPVSTTLSNHLLIARHVYSFDRLSTSLHSHQTLHWSWVLSYCGNMILSLYYLSGKAAA